MQQASWDLPHFYLPPENWQKTVSLEAAETRHLSSVLRLKEGDEVALLDGQGRTGRFCIKAISKKSCLLELDEEMRFPKPVSRPVIALALSKAVRRGFFLEKAVELGAYAIWLWQGDTSQGKLVSTMEEALKRQMIAGAKQCRNPWIPEIRLFPKGLQDLLVAAEPIKRRILPWELEDPEAMIGKEHLGREGETLYVIGPEGGFSERELALLDNAAFTRVSLGSRILRCETAAVLCLGLHWWAMHKEAAESATPVGKQP